MPLQATSGTASYDAFGGGIPVVPNYIEDVFSTYLYTGAGGAQTVSTGIDLATYGGLLWNKNRTSAVSNVLTDTVRGANAQLVSNTTAAQGNYGVGLSFLTNGFSLSSVDSAFNTSGANYASWTFRKQPKFFDVVTFTSTSSTNQRISHSLGSVPGMIIVKGTNNPTSWMVWHRSLSTTTSNYMELQSTAAQQSQSNVWGTSGPTSTDFGIDGSWFGSGGQWVAYIFAHNAGGFGLTGTDNVISCGSYTTDASGYATVNLGYEPQWVLSKRSSAASNWIVVDNMRGFTTGGGTNQQLYPNTSGAEVATTGPVSITSTGFNAISGASVTNIYIAIRRGPMKVPTSGTIVFTPVIYTGDGAASRSIFSGGFNPDMVFLRERSAVNFLAPIAQDRLRGTPWLYTPFTDAEVDYGATVAVGFNSKSNTLTSGTTSGTDTNRNTINYSMEVFKRAPSFFDVVCYTGTGSARTVTHNLGVAPELMIVRNRPNSGGYNWTVYSSTTGPTKALYLNDTLGGQTYSGFWNDTAPTSSVFTVGIDGGVNANTSAIVAYLFATCPGVSKVGTYTGNGTTQTIDCGFTGGARFVLIKRTDAAGDWYVYDTARGMTTLTDPYLLLNSTAAETATLGSVTTVSTGFALNSSILAAINVNAGTYIFLAIA